MGISKSVPNNITSPDGNSLAVFLDDNDSTLKLKDIYGNIDDLENYTPSGSSIQNVGGGKEIYLNSTNNPSKLRTLVQGANVTLTEGAETIQIDAGNTTGTTLYYGSFISTQTQTSLGNEQKAMTLNTTILSNGISIENNSRIKVAHTGIYNFQFSAQLLRTSGGQAQQIYIWFKINGSNIPDSNTVLTLANNGQLIVAAWNFVTQLNANQYIEIFWYATASTIELHYNASPVVGLPAIPSLIATMNRIG